MSDIKKVLQLLSPHKWTLLLVALFNLLATFFSLFSIAFLAPLLSLIFNQTERVTELPDFAFSSEAILSMVTYFFGQMIDDKGVAIALLIALSIIFCCFFLFKFFAYIALWVITSVRTSIVENYRNAAYKKLLDLPLSFYSSTQKGDIVSKMVNDVQEIDQSVLEPVQNLIKNPLMVALYLIALFFLNFQLTLFVLILLPLAGFFVSRLQRKLKMQSQQAKEQQSEMTATSEESIYALRIVKAFNAISQMSERFATINRNYNRIFIKITRKRDLSSPLGEFLGMIIAIIILLFGSMIVLNPTTNFSVEAFLAYIALFVQIINPFKSIAESLANLKKGYASIDRVNTFLNLDIKIEEKKNPICLHGFSDKIVFEQVDFSYGTTDVLHSLSFEVRKGSKVAICGHSGAGKTTVVDLLLRFYDINSGKIVIDGVEIKDCSLASLRSLFGLVSQDSILFNDTIYNNIVFTDEQVPQEKVEQVCKIANIYDFIIQQPEGFQTNVGDRGVKLSGGQKQRISIARALLKDPPILILDEATSALDNKLEKSVQQAIDAVSENRTCIIIAHRLSTIANADNILLMEDGAIVESGTDKQLKALNGKYKAMVDQQSFC